MTKGMTNGKIRGEKGQVEKTERKDTEKRKEGKRKTGCKRWKLGKEERRENMEVR